MARDGSGNYSRVEGPYVNGAIADADEVNNELDDIGSALTTSINTSGTKAFAANQPMGGFKLTGLAAGSAAGDSLRYEQLVGAYQPLDALLTAIAALTTADDRMLDFTGVDTVAVVTYATVFTNLGVQTAGDARYAQLAAANTFTANQAISKTTPIFYMTDAGGGPTTLAQFMLSGVYYWEFASVNKLSVSTTVTEFLSNDLRITAAPTALATNSAGFRGLPVSGGTAKDADYTPVIGDAGFQVIFYLVTVGRTFTIPPNSSVAYPIGTVIGVNNYPGSGYNVSVAEGAGVTLYRGDGTAGSGTRTVTPYSYVSLVKVDTNTWQIMGVFV